MYILLILDDNQSYMTNAGGGEGDTCIVVNAVESVT